MYNNILKICKGYKVIGIYLLTSMAMIDVNKLEALKTKIETLNKFHQVEILKILSKNLCKLNENKSGIFINMSFLEEDVVEELTKYVDYIDDQNETFQTIEYQKDEFKNTLTVESIENYASLTN
tara:strand:+ start:1390 stop:1761 length:372 start_codon:yes stop_codon:yes gene_type:complete